MTTVTGTSAVLVVPDLGHADLLADDRFGCHGRMPFSSHADAPLGQTRRSVDSVVPRGSRGGGRPQTSICEPDESSGLRTGRAAHQVLRNGKERLRGRRLEATCECRYRHARAPLEGRRPVLPWSVAGEAAAPRWRGGRTPVDRVCDLADRDRRAPTPRRRCASRRRSRRRTVRRRRNPPTKAPTCRARRWPTKPIGSGRGRGPVRGSHRRRPTMVKPMIECPATTSSRPGCTAQPAHAARLGSGHRPPPDARAVAARTIAGLTGCVDGC